MSAETDFVNYVVVGIGINANMTEFPEEISATATSLAIESGHRVSRSRIVAEFFKLFEGYYGTFIKDGNLSGLRKEYESELVNMNNMVAVITSDGELRRKAVGINDDGELLVEDEAGNVTSVRSGEVSVRGIYGYV